MKLLRLLCICTLSISLLRCSTANENNLSGIWTLINSENCDKNFLGLNPYIYPYVMYGHKIYITDSNFYNPFVQSEGLPFEKEYRLKKGQICLENVGQIEFIKQDSMLILKQKGCELVFLQQTHKETLPQNSLSEIIFYVRNSERELVDSVRLKRIGRTSHIFRIAESIEMDDLNKEFDKNTSDTNENTLILQLYNGKSYQIISSGKYETPFEVKTLLTYLFAEMYPR